MNVYEDIVFLWIICIEAMCCIELICRLHSMMPKQFNSLSISKKKEKCAFQGWIFLLWIIGIETMWWIELICRVHSIMSKWFISIIMVKNGEEYFWRKTSLSVNRTHMSCSGVIRNLWDLFTMTWIFWTTRTQLNFHSKDIWKPGI